MILTDEEVRQIQRTIEAQAGLDEELLHRCGHLIHMGAFDEAVRSAFVLLEERLREATKQEGMTGSALANHAFKSDGPLAKLLAHSESERQGLRELYSGAFKLFRNPTAHGVVNYSDAEGKVIIGLVNLLLMILLRAGKMPPPGLLSANVGNVLNQVEQNIGAGPTSRLRLFLGQCVQMGLTPSKSPKYWISFKRYAFVQYSWWDEPKAYRIPAFYIGKRSLQVPVNGYYSIVAGLDVEPLTEELEELGFQPSGKNREPTIQFQTHNSQEFFDILLEFLQRVAEMFEESLQQQE